MDAEEKQRNIELGRQLVSEQNFPRAVLFGAIAMVLGASLFGAIASTGGAIGFMAAGIGLFVGFAMQVAGQGIETRFGVVAVIFAVAGCLLGNLMAVVFFIATVSDASALRVLSETPPAELFGWLTETLGFADLIFWLLAAGAAGYFVNRRLSREERLAVGLYEMQA